MLGGTKRLTGSMQALTGYCWRRHATMSAGSLKLASINGVRPLPSTAAGFAPAATSTCTTSSRPSLEA